MNKKLLALAVAGAFVAPAAMAQGNTVQIYGTLSMSVDSVDGGTGGVPSVSTDNAERRTRVSSNTSYIGFKGTEDLGNGLDAHFQIEQQVGLDGGAGSGGLNGGWGSGRNNFLGIGSKSWGSLDFGLIDSPLKTSTGKLDLFGGGHTIADYRSTFVMGTTIDSVRAANSVYYTSPNFNGFTLRVQTAAQQENGSSRNPSFWSASGTYENGPIFAVLATEHTKAVGGGGNVYSVGGQTLTATGDWEAKIKSWRAGVGYNFGPGKVGIAYSNVKTDATALTGTLGGSLADSVTSTNYKRTAWHASGEYNVTKATAIGLQYTKAGNINDIANSGVSQWSLGVKQTMSKRTTLYALYTQVRNQSAARYSLGGGASGVHGVVAAAAGEDPKAISVGMIHKF